jgi:tyrosyl-tRNA synthetase
MPKTSDCKNSKDCITVGGTTFSEQQVINRVISFEDKMSKTELTEYKKQLKDKDCKALVKMLIPPREPKSKCAKKPAAGRKPVGVVKKPAAKAKQTANKTKSNCRSCVRIDPSWYS